MFTHEKFDAYKFAIEFSRLALQLTDELSIGHSTIRDQLKRAALSIPLNIAEGTGKNSLVDRKRFYAIARGSAMERAAICDIIRLIDEGYAPSTELGKQKLKSIVGILSVVCSRK